MGEELWRHKMAGPFRRDNMLRCHTPPLSSQVLDMMLQNLGVHNCMVIQTQR